MLKKKFSLILPFMLKDDSFGTKQLSVNCRFMMIHLMTHQKYLIKLILDEAQDKSSCIFYSPTKI